MVSVAKIDSMLAKTLESAVPAVPAAAGHPAGRFGRDPAEYRRGPATLTLVPNPPEQGRTP